MSKGKWGHYGPAAGSSLSNDFVRRTAYDLITSCVNPRLKELLNKFAYVVAHLDRKYLGYWDLVDTINSHTRSIKADTEAWSDLAKSLKNSTTWSDNVNAALDVVLGKTVNNAKLGYLKESGEWFIRRIEQTHTRNTLLSIIEKIRLESGVLQLYTCESYDDIFGPLRSIHSYSRYLTMDENSLLEDLRNQSSITLLPQPQDDNNISHINTKTTENGKAKSSPRGQTNVSRPVTKIRRSGEIRGSVVHGRTKRAAIEVGHLSNQTCVG